MTTQQLPTTDTLSPPVPAIPENLHCQKCDNESRFIYLGEQIWSTLIAEKLQIQPRVTLWNCEKCGTTFTYSTPMDC